MHIAKTQHLVLPQLLVLLGNWKSDSW
jgi:hypothetical protein